jgi:hypothetical protein
MTPEEKFAADWVEKRHTAIAELLRDEVPLRYRILSFMLLEPDTGVVKDGLPAVYLVRLARRDRLVFDLLVDILTSGKSQPPIIEEQREPIRSGAFAAPPKPKGRPYKNGGRDFLFLIMCAELQAKFPELPLGSGDETRGIQSAMSIALDALAITGVPLIREREKKKDLEEPYPVERNAEKALRRFLQGIQIPEIFWD